MRPYGQALLIHPDLYAGGGAEVHAARILRLLQDRFERVTAVHTGGPLDAERIARAWGVRLDPERVNLVALTGAACRLARAGRGYALLQYALALRHARRLAPEHDLVVTTFGECTVAAPRVLQAMCIPLFLDDRDSLRHLGVLSPNPVAHLLRRAYVRACRRLAGWNPAEVRRHATTANSKWTAGVVNAAYRMDHARCHYPGAHTAITPDSARYVPFEQRQDGFVIVGRLVPNKRVETAIEIVEGLRRGGHDVHLHVVGKASGPYGEALGRRIAQKPHVTLHPDLPRDEMEALIAGHRYGLHAYEYEHFGSAPAELQRLGCLVFVHDSGGQREVVRAPEQRYRDVPDAIEKIARVMADPALRGRLRPIAAAVNVELTLAAFEKQFLGTVDTVMGRPASPLPPVEDVA